MSERIDLMLCRWAEAKFDLADVVEVQFEAGAHGPYSDVTPDIDPYIEVRVKTSDGRWRNFDDWTYNTDLIRDILRFATEESE